MKNAVYGILRNRNNTSYVINQIKSAGFEDSDISVLSAGEASTGGESVRSDKDKDTKAPEGAMTGGAVGAGAGALVGLLAGIGALAIPGLGPFIAAGPIVGALSGAGVGAAAGGVVGGLIGLGIPEHEAKVYHERIQSGDLLLGIHVESNEESLRAKRILETCGVENISAVGQFDASMA